MTKSKTIGATFIISGVVLLVFSAFAFFVVPKIFAPPQKVFIGSGSFEARLALNEESREKGLSGVSKLDSDQVLLMVFDSEDRWSIWMKDMKIPIDVVWLDSNKKVIYIVKNISPITSTDKVFLPKDPAKYVIEFPAGSVDEYSINLNSLAIFQLDEETD